MTNQEAINSYVVYLKTSGHAEKTIKDYTSILTKFFDFVDIGFEQINKDNILNFIHELQQRGNVNTSVNQRISCLNSFFYYLREYGHIKNKVHHGKFKDKGLQKRLAERDYLSPDHFDQYTTQLNNYFSGRNTFLTARKHLLATLLLFGGMREFEAADILESGITYLPNNDPMPVYKIDIEHGKGDKYRWIHVPASKLKEPYEKYVLLKTKAGIKSEYLLCTSTGHRWHETEINKAVKSITKRLGYDLKLTPHRLRDAYADAAVTRGCDIESLSASLGHSNVGTTIRKYLRTHEGQQKKVANFFR